MLPANLPWQRLQRRRWLPVAMPTGRRVPSIQSGPGLFLFLQFRLQLRPEVRLSSRIRLGRQHSAMSLQLLQRNAKNDWNQQACLDRFKAAA